MHCARHAPTFESGHGLAMKRGIPIGPLRSLRGALFRCLCDAPRESTVRKSIDSHGGDCMARRAKLTQEMVDEAIRLKADGLSNGDIVCALGIHESTFYRWIGDPKK